MAKDKASDGKFPCDECEKVYEGPNGANTLAGHKSRYHPKATEEESESEPREPLDRKVQFLDAMKRAGITNKANGAIADIFFAGDVDNAPKRLVKALKLIKADRSQTDILMQLWYGKTLDAVEAEEDEEDDEEEEASPRERKKTKEGERDPVAAARRMALKELEEMKADLEIEKVKRQMEEMRAARQGGTPAEAKPAERLVDYTGEDGITIQVSVPELIRLKQADAVKSARNKPEAAKKTRVLDNGAPVEMTDDEWASYQTALSLAKRNQASQSSDTERLIRETKEAHEREMRELKAAFDRREEDHRWTALKKEMEETRAAAQHNPFATYLEMSEMAQRAGLTTKPADQQRLGIEQTKVEKMLGGLLSQQQHHHKIVEEGVGAAKDILVEMKRAEIRAAQGLPPEEGQYAAEPAAPEAPADGSGA